jgi:hypothetical protein
MAVLGYNSVGNSLNNCCCTWGMRATTVAAVSILQGLMKKGYLTWRRSGRKPHAKPAAERG